ncbi:hypothetical protein [Adlercreutzia sp. ZJ304]|uniref:hypothetical protein n=1 Tax=Adlercreutzia sp. ZJ304 TaxID=2709791 RepID=UPI0013EC17AB|nr:hypothetical protein [Adlercreutzia sp. ZJ304]
MGNLHEDVFLDLGFDELSIQDFYRELFQYSNSYMKYHDDMQVPVTLSAECGGTWKSVALRNLEEIITGRNDAYISACTYFPHKGRDGRWHSLNGKDHADQLCAFVVDLDYGEPQAVKYYFEPAAFDEEYGLIHTPGYYWLQKDKPNPTYVVCSGRGMHFYYVLATPVSVMKRWRKELDVINRSLYDEKHDMRSSANEFDEYVASGLGNRDYHGITQPYRVVGSLPKTGHSLVTAWRTGNPIEIEELARFAGLSQVKFTVDEFDMSKSLMKKEITTSKNKPYVKKTNRRGWNPGFYRWLAQREKDHTRLYGEYGHRYKQVQALTIASIKDRIPREQLIADVKEIHAGWNECAKKYGHPEIGWDECEKAMRCFEDCPDHRHFPKWWLEDLCGWEFGTQKRNGKSQRDHLENRAWVFRDLDYPDGSWRYRGGAPTKKVLIKEYAASHPEANHSEIARALGVSRPTVIKWLKNQSER